MNDKAPHEESFYLEAMLKNDPFVTKRIYKEFYPRIKRMVTSNSGNADDAWDVFQDAMVVVYKRALNPDFVLTCPFYYFLRGISWNIWLRELRGRGLRPKVTFEDDDEYIDEANVEDAIHQMERHALYKEKFAELSEKCQRLIQLVFQKKKMREIAVLLNHKNAHTTRQQHFKCRKKLKELVQKDARFVELKGF